MTLGPLMVDLRGHVLESDEREMLRHPLVGSVILFTRNYRDPEQLTQLVSAIHATSHGQDDPVASSWLLRPPPVHRHLRPEG